MAEGPKNASEIVFELRSDLLSCRKAELSGIERAAKLPERTSWFRRIFYHGELDAEQQKIMSDASTAEMACEVTALAKAQSRFSETQISYEERLLKKTETNIGLLRQVGRLDAEKRQLSNAATIYACNAAYLADELAYARGKPMPKDSESTRLRKLCFDRAIHPERYLPPTKK